MPTNNQTKTYTLAAYAGIVNLALVIPAMILGVIEAIRGELPPTLRLATILVMIATVVLGIVYAYGFLKLGRAAKNGLLVSSAVLFMAIGTVSGLLSVVDQLVPNTETVDMIFLGIYAVLVFLPLGVGTLLFGVALRRLRPWFGSLANSTGIVAIIVGAGLLSVIFIIPAFLLILPLSIMSIMLLFRAARMPEFQPPTDQAA